MLAAGKKHFVMFYNFIKEQSYQLQFGNFISQNFILFLVIANHDALMPNQIFYDPPLTRKSLHTHG